MNLFKYETEEEQLKAVKWDGDEIMYIHNPSEKVQLAAVKRDWHSIRYIHNPSEKAQLEAVKQNADAIQFIHNPSEKVQLATVRGREWQIEYIRNPSEKVQLEVIKKYPGNIRYINNPTEKVIRYLIDNHASDKGIMQLLFAKIGRERYDKLSDEDKLRIIIGGLTIKLFKYETEKEQLVAVKEDGYNIRYIYNPSEKVQLAAVKQNCYSIQFISNPSKKVQLKATKLLKKIGASTFITNINTNPSGKTQLKEIKNTYGYAIMHIPNPSEKVIRYLLDNYSSNGDIMQLLFAKIGREGYDKLSDEDKSRIKIGG